MGHIQTLFYSSSHYIFFFIDNYKVHLCLFYEKNYNFFSKLQEFKLTVEGVHKKKIKRCDR